ncbi:unnamed protein product, partial [Polarella glacialis]
MSKTKLPADPEEPFFVQFRRELVHHEKSALSNPSQMLKLLTGQEMLHYPFLLLREQKQQAGTSGGEVSASNPRPRSASPPSGKALQVRAALKLQREQKAVEKGEASLSSSAGIWAMLPQLQDCQDPSTACRLLLDILVGTGRVLDDLRSLGNVRKALPEPRTQLEALRAAVEHLEGCICWLRPKKLELGQEALDDLIQALEKADQRGRDTTGAIRSWLARISDQGLLPSGTKCVKGRRLKTLTCGIHVVDICRPGVRAGTLAKKLKDFQYLFYRLLAEGRDCFWKADLAPRTQDDWQSEEPHFRDGMRQLACHLFVLVDLVRGDEYTGHHTQELRVALGE